jgi:arylsulfatase A-like enzyme
MKVIVIAVPGWHAGWLGCYGNEWISTPHLDCLASEGVVFDQHFANVPTSEGAIQSWKTGRYDSTAGPDLFAALSEQGIACVGLRDVCVKDRPTVTHDWDILIETDEEIDLCSGVDTFLEGFDPEFPALFWAETDQLLPPWIIDPELYAEYAGTLGQSRPVAPQPEHPGCGATGLLQPWPDPPIGPVGKEIALWERSRHSYAAAVTAFDEQIGVISESIKAHLSGDSVLLIVTAGWGFPLGEHGFVGPGLPQLHEESVHIPLILRFPGAAHAGRRISAFSLNIDLLPTIFDAFSLQVPSQVQGRSLLPLVNRTATALRPYAVCQLGSSGLLRTAEWACLRWQNGEFGPAAQLFRKPNDRWEVNDLRQHYLPWAEYLEQTLKTLETLTQSAESLEFPPLRDYTDIVNPVTSPEEPTDEHRSTRGREHDQSQGEGGLRGHQGDQED